METPAAINVVQAKASTTLDATALFEWAESTYPSLFPGPKANTTVTPYVLRHYPETQNYLGVANGIVYALGPVTGNSLATLGTLSSFSCKVFPSNCSAVANPVTNASTAGIRCSESVSAFNSSASVNANSTASWTCNSTQRLLTANGMPDHAVGTFPNADNPNAITAQSVSVSATLSPAVVSTTGTATQVVGYVMNGVKLDPNTGGTCDNTGTSCSLVGGSGAWRMEALGQTSFKFGTDSNNAHVQPGGAYHYHGMPEGYIAKLNKGQTMTLVGWASDGFPIYARYGYTTANDAGSAIKVMKGSYRTKTTPDTGRPATSLYPMGTFLQDYEYVAGLGDLDECNGRVGVTPEFPNGTYHYYATDTYPYLQRCVKGTVTATATAPGAGGPPPPR